MNREFTVADLARILRLAAGEDGGVAEETVDVPFHELGLESLALLEASVLIRQEFGVDLDDSVLTDAGNPRALVGIVNNHLSVTAGTDG
ncbi:acyl carrier protein [Actinophytocola sediminis]